MIRKLAHIYKYQLSLRVKMLITHLILTLIPALLITIFAYNQMVSVTTNTTLHSLNTLADQTRTNIGSTINQFDSMADGICDNEFFSSYDYLVEKFLFSSCTSKLIRYYYKEKRYQLSTFFVNFAKK